MRFLLLTALYTYLFTNPPITSTGPFPWKVAKSDVFFSNVERAAAKYLFLNLDVGLSDQICTTSIYFRTSFKILFI